MEKVPTTSEVFRRLDQPQVTILIFGTLDDGRVDIDFNSSVIRAFSKCFPSPPTEDLEPAPPAYDSKKPVGFGTASNLKWTVKLNIVVSNTANIPIVKKRSLTLFVTRFKW